MSELKFAIDIEALQYLADMTGKRVKIATEEYWGMDFQGYSVVFTKDGQINKTTKNYKFTKMPEDLQKEAIATFEVEMEKPEAKRILWRAD